MTPAAGGMSNDDRALRDYAPADETSWLRCRVLGFLDTAYFDDVVTRKPARDLALVAISGGQVAGLLDASINGPEATIETIAVHPDHRRRGIARALLDEACTRLAAQGAQQVDAWTRDDEGTLAWYVEHGFVERMRYLHVYTSTSEEAAAFPGNRPELMLRSGFFHASIEHEDTLRAEFQRVHVCRQYVRSLGETAIGRSAGDDGLVQ